jgi:two-component system chemotaxis response regulator CheB
VIDASFCTTCRRSPAPGQSKPRSDPIAQPDRTPATREASASQRRYDLLVGRDGGRAGTSSDRSNVVVLAASAGALPALRKVLSDLPFDFPSAIIVVRHRRREAFSSLVELLQSHTTLPVEWARFGDVPTGSRVYVVPSGQDLSLDHEGAFAFEPGTFPFRGIDPLIVSLAAWSGRDGTAVILTGSGADGAAGSLALHRAGGTVIVQSTESVETVGMGRAAIAVGAATFVLGLHEIGPALIELASGARATATVSVSES